MAKFEALDVAVEMIAALRPVLEWLERHDMDLAKQLRRSSSSVALNLAEGAHRIGRDRLHSFRVAAGSNAEVVACLRVAEASYSIPIDLVTCRELLDRLGAMTYRLTENLHSRGR